MSIKRPALALGSGPRGVRDARRWIVEWCVDLGRPDLVDCAELAVSELVTNALLHGSPPIEVSVGGTDDHPRIEVRDGSLRLPDLSAAGEEASEDDDVLLTFGRGLTLVARSSQAWGADVDDAGKVVWFEPAAAFCDDDGPAGVITGEPRDDDAADQQEGEPVEFWLLGAPVRAYLGFQRHYRELRREIRLLALAHGSTYPVAKDLAELFGTVEPPLYDSLAPGGRRPPGYGGHHADLRVQMPREAAARLDRFAELLELADAFCREERLLSLARSPEQREFQTWFLAEIVAQAAGRSPIAWAEELSPSLRSGVS